MKCSPSHLFLIAAASLALATNLVSAQSPDALAAQLVDGLKKANLTAIADLASTHGSALLPVLLSGGSKTLLAPSNEAVFKVQTKLSGATPAQIDAILKYHIINGTISYKSLPDAFDYHVIAPTYLNDSTFTNLPAGENQVVVLSRSDSRDPIDVSFGYGDTHFTGTQDGPTIGSLTIQVIDDVMIPPANFSFLTLGEKDESEFRSSLGKMNLTPSVILSKGLTIFAPNDEAFKAVQDKLLKANQQDFHNILKNHIINGTVAYSVQLPSNVADNDGSTGKITHLHTSAGETITFAYSSDGGHLQVTCGNSTANVVKTDKIINNGVVHYLDQVLLNTQSNATQASDTAPQSQKAIPDLAAQSTSATQDSNKASSKNSAGAHLTPSITSLLLLSSITVIAASYVGFM